jgi:hypothetical protein
VLGSGVRASVGRVVANWSSFPPFDPVREAVARTDSARLAPARSSPPSVALCPCVPARSSMSGASRPAREAKESCQSIKRPPTSVSMWPPPGVPSHGGRYVIDERARPWSRRFAAGVPGFCQNVPEKRAAEGWRSGPGCAMIDRTLAWTPLRTGVFIAPSVALRPRLRRVRRWAAHRCLPRAATQRALPRRGWVFAERARPCRVVRRGRCGARRSRVPSSGRQLVEVPAARSGSLGRNSN